MNEENKNEETREMHDAVCSDCGKDTKVPFEPQEGRPVYCRDCYQKNRPPRKRFGGNNRGGFRERGNRQKEWNNE